MTGWAARLAIVSALVIAACSGGPASTKYTQTWTKSYSTTTCGDWDDRMDVHQRFVMASDFLLTFHQRVKNSKDPNVVPIPPDNILNAFASAISLECQDKHTDLVSLTAAAVFETQQDLFRPT